MYAILHQRLYNVLNVKMDSGGPPAHIVLIIVNNVPKLKELVRFAYQVLIF